MTIPSIRRHAGTVPPPIDALAAAADDEGHGFVRRTIEEWASGDNRFANTGEVFFMAEFDGNIVGMCGVNVDGYVDDPTVGRLRHLYVSPSQRGSGLGERLVMRCLDHAANHFGLVRLRTPGPAADHFYDNLGFERADSNNATHVWRFGGG